MDTNEEIPDRCSGRLPKCGLESADWSVLSDRADIAVFQDHLADPDAVIERLLPFDVVCVMRERTPLPRKVVERLPISSSSPRRDPKRVDRSSGAIYTPCDTASDDRRRRRSIDAFMDPVEAMSLRLGRRSTTLRG